MSRSHRLYRVFRDPAHGSTAQLYMITEAQRVDQLAVKLSQLVNKYLCSVLEMQEIIKTWLQFSRS